MIEETELLAFSQEQFESWHDDPVKFCHDVFPDIVLEQWQIEALEAVGRNDLVGFLASKGVGKSFLEAIVGFWWLTTRKMSQVICTSIDADNLKKGLWKEIEGLYRRSPFLQASFEMNSEQVYAKPDETGQVIPWGRDEWSMASKGWRQRADSIEQAQALAGIHGDHMLWLGDEAGSYHNAILASGEAMRANIGNGREAKILLGGNTTDPTGPLGIIRTDKNWKIIKVNGDPDNPKRCTRVSAKWARDLIDTRGRDDPWVKVMVFGEFPDVGFNSLLGPADVETSVRWNYLPAVYQRSQKRMGVDVARFGDDQSVIYIRQGLVAGPWWELSGLDTMQLADRIVFEFKRTGCEVVFIDETGVGAGVVDAVRRQLRGTGRVVGVNSSSKATEFEKYHNKRAELCWTFADWVKNQRGQVPMADQKLREELIQPTYNFKGGKILIEEKAQIKERLGRSPDNYDALLQTFALQEMPSIGPQGLAMLHSLAEKKRAEYDPNDDSRAGEFSVNPD